MTIAGIAHTVTARQGRTVDLGVAQMRVLANGDVANGGAFTLAEFSGTAAGPWTVPHLHRGMEESFYVLDGHFTFDAPTSFTQTLDMGSPGALKTVSTIRAKWMRQ